MANDPHPTIDWYHWDGSTSKLFPTIFTWIMDELEDVVTFHQPLLKNAVGFAFENETDRTLFTLRWRGELIEYRGHIPAYNIRQIDGN